MLTGTRRRLYEILEISRPGDLASRAFDIFIMALISLNEEITEQAVGEVSATGGKAWPVIDESRAEEFISELRARQSLTAGLAAGAVAALASAVVWAVVTAITSFQIGWMAIGAGCLVGYAIRTFGKGIDRSFGIMGAVLAVLGCVLGNLLSVCIMISQQEGVPVSSVMSILTPDIAGELMAITFHPIDVVFYAMAIYAGYKFSVRQITEQQLLSLNPEKV